MVERALNLWVACRTIDRSWEVCDEETVGILTKEISWRGMSPINPIMQTQLDQIVIRDTLNPLRMDILQELSHKIEANKPEFWLEIYLTIFTLLNSIEVASAENHLVAKRWGRPVRLMFLPLSWEKKKLADSFYLYADAFCGHETCRGMVPHMQNPAVPISLRLWWIRAMAG